MFRRHPPGRLEALALVLLAACAGCAARAARVTEPGLSCAQATEVARTALARLGYTVTRVEPPVPGRPGLVTGERQLGWAPAAPEPGATRSASVAITCTDAGATLSATSDEPGLSGFDFADRFARAVRDRLDVKPVAPGLYAAPEEGLVVTVEPLRAREAAATFGVDLPALGVTPVRVDLANRTPRRYGFRVADVRLVTVEGQRPEPLGVAEVTARLPRRPEAPAIAGRLESAALQDAVLAPGATHTGYLFLPAAAYQHMRVTVTDIETGEEEGVSAEF